MDEQTFQKALQLRQKIETLSANLDCFEYWQSKVENSPHSNEVIPDFYYKQQRFRVDPSTFALYLEHERERISDEMFQAKEQFAQLEASDETPFNNLAKMIKVLVVSTEEELDIEKIAFLLDHLSKEDVEVFKGSDHINIGRATKEGEQTGMLVVIHEDADMFRADFHAGPDIVKTMGFFNIKGLHDILAIYSGVLDMFDWSKLDIIDSSEKAVQPRTKKHSYMEEDEEDD